MHPHNLGPEHGEYLLNVFSTIEEMRNYFPEPTEYFTITNPSEWK